MQPVKLQLITMNFLIVCSLTLTLLIHSSSCSTARDLWDSPVICSSGGIACDYTNENIIDQITGVPTVDMCRELCLDINDCQFFSYFDETATPFPGFCELFKSCERINNCSNCYTENINCGTTCGTNVIGDLDENVLDVISNIQSEIECKALCIKNVTC